MATTNEFDKYRSAAETPTQEWENAVDDETGEVVDPTPKNEIAKKEQHTEIAKKETVTERFLNQVMNEVAVSGQTFGAKQRALATDIIININKNITGTGYKWSDLDLIGCNLPAQIKQYANVGLSYNDHLYLDIRHNSKTNKKDINIKMQYQTVEKLMTKYFKYPIERFVSDVICEGDDFQTKMDFETGLLKIIDHVKDPNVNRNDYAKITGAYKIAFVKEDPNSPKLTQYVCVIDKNRIDRAKNASASREKTVWNNDTQKMVKKTVTWEMYNSELIRPFMIFPEDIIEDVDSIVRKENDSMDWNKETKFKTTEQAQDKIETNVAANDVIDMKYED